MMTYSGSKIFDLWSDLPNKLSYFVSWVFSFCFFINWNILGWLLINIKTYYMKGTSTNIGRSTSSQQSNIWYRRLLTCRDHDIVSFHIISELYLIESLHFDKFMKYTKFSYITRKISKDPKTSIVMILFMQWIFCF